MNQLKTATSLIIFLFLLTRSSHAQTYADIRFSCKQCVGQEFQITDFTLVTSKSRMLFRGIVGDTGVVSTRVPVQYGHMLWLSVKKGETVPVRQEDFYVEPGDLLDVSLTDSTWSAEGVPGRVHRHLSRIKQVDKERNEVFKDSYSYTKDMDSLEIRTAFRQLNAYREEIDKEVTSDDLLPQRLKELLFAANSASEAGFELFLDTRKVYVRQFRKQKEPASFVDLPERLINKNMLPVSFRYRFPLTGNISMRLSEIIDQYRAETNGPIYGYLKDKITQNRGFAVFPDYFMAYSLLNVPFLTNISFDELQDMFSSFRTDYPGSPFHQELEPVLEEYAALKPGAPAPDFEMVSPKGDSLRLSDFKGKLVYIDLWATWCVPCREEFKYSKKLSDRYAGREDLVFMYVSMQNDTEAWRKFLSKNPSLKGIHGIQQESSDPEKPETTAFRLYKAPGIPHYILIDKAGNIIDRNAPRPSELVRSGYLEQLLKP